MALTAATPEAAHLKRLDGLRAVMRERGIDAVVLFDPACALYLSGYWTILSAMAPQACVVGPTAVELIIPSLETAAAELLPIPIAVSPYRNYPLRQGGLESPARQFLTALLETPSLLRAQTVGVDLEAARMPAARVLAERFESRMTDVGPLMREMRAEKDRLELSLLHRAAEIAAQAVMGARRCIAAGTPEVALAGQLAGAIRSAGGVPTHIVIGSGPRSALAHPEPTDRRFAPGELVLIDVGVLYRGYWAEVARTYAIGAAARPQRDWHRAVERARQAAAERIAPGAMGGEVDRAARAVLHAHGYDGTQFNHAAGHGLGVLGMDRPLIAPDSQDAIPADCALTLEPALYFKGEGGVRIEDTFLVTEGRMRNLTGGVPQGLDPMENT